MSRVIFSENSQAEWINCVLREKSISTKEAANICDVSPRTFRDWRREKYKMSKSALLKLSNKTKTDLPKNIRYVSDYWYVAEGARLGGLKRYELYGVLGDKRSRKNGGLVSQRKRRENPDKYRLVGCNVKKNYSFVKKSESFAEIIGIVLGDGGITKNQLRVYLGRKSDREYAHFVNNLLENVFRETPAWYERKHNGVIILCISGTGLVEELKKWGVNMGNKVEMQVDFPKWIWEKEEYVKACVRGLMDTDGSVYSYSNQIRGTKYSHNAICFTNASIPLLQSCSKALDKLGIKHTTGGRKLYLYSRKSIEKYFQKVGSNNPKHKRGGIILQKVSPGLK